MIPLPSLALGAVALTVVTVAVFLSRVHRSPRDTVRSLAARNTPIPQIAQRTHLPQDVVRTILRTSAPVPMTRNRSPVQEATAGPARPKSPASERSSPRLRVIRAATAR